MPTDPAPAPPRAAMRTASFSSSSSLKTTSPSAAFPSLASDIRAPVFPSAAEAAEEEDEDDEEDAAAAVPTKSPVPSPMMLPDASTRETWMVLCSLRLPARWFVRKQSGLRKGREG